MRIFKSHPILRLVNSYIIDSPQPSNLSYLWNFGSLLAFCLVIQIITGVTLAMHYNPSVLEAFNSVEHIMRDVNNGWLIRYLHSNTASAFFFIVYLHIGRGLYYGSYRSPRTLVWTIGTVIFLLMIATAFLGYVLPYGQMSLWGATVITNLMSAIPWVGQDIVEFLWGGFSVNNATLNRFFALHFVLPFVLAALALMHLIALHDSAGSGNPLGTSGNYDRLPFAPYFLFKDLITIFIFILLLSMLVFFMPNLLGDSENYVMANPMQTPPAIVPEWYLLPFYAILRSIPNKLLGVIAMFSAILVLLTMPFTDLSRSRGIQFRPLSKIAFFIFIANFFVLMLLGAKHVESPFIEFGQVSTVLYFAHFLITVPFISLIENSLVELASPPKSHSFTTLPLQSLFISGLFTKLTYTLKVLYSYIYLPLLKNMTNPLYLNALGLLVRFIICIVNCYCYTLGLDTGIISTDTIYTAVSAGAAGVYAPEHQNPEDVPINSSSDSDPGKADSNSDSNSDSKSKSNSESDIYGYSGSDNGLDPGLGGDTVPTNNNADAEAAAAVAANLGAEAAAAAAAANAESEADSNADSDVANADSDSDAANAGSDSDLCYSSDNKSDYGYRPRAGHGSGSGSAARSNYEHTSSSKRRRLG